MAIQVSSLSIAPSPEAQLFAENTTRAQEILDQSRTSELAWTVVQAFMEERNTNLQATFERTNKKLPWTIVIDGSGSCSKIVIALLSVSREPSSRIVKLLPGVSTICSLGLAYSRWKRGDTFIPIFGELASGFASFIPIYGNAINLLLSMVLFGQDYWSGEFRVQPVEGEVPVIGRVLPNVDRAYTILGLLQDDTREAVDRAFQRLSLHFHPDRVQAATGPLLRAQFEDCQKVLSSAKDMIYQQRDWN